MVFKPNNIMSKHGYTASVPLNHDEALLKKNIRTGVITDLSVKRVSNNKTLVNYKTHDIFQRRYPKAWDLLETQTTDKELAVAYKLANKAQAYTNSLQPLRPESTITELSEELNVNRNIVGKIVDKLFKLGVIGKFEVYDRHETHHNYWIFNPYLSFNGNVIKHDLYPLFQNTYYAKV